MPPPPGLDGWRAIDLQGKRAVFLKTPRASHDYMPSSMMGELARELGTMRRILHTIPKHSRLVNVIEVTPPHAPKPCVTSMVGWCRLNHG